jgi:malate synthase
MTKRIQVGGLQIAEVLHDLVANEITPGIGISAEAFWQGLGNCLIKMELLDAALLDKRNQLQAQIDAWHQQHANQPHDPVAYKAFLHDIGYLLPEGDDFTISTSNTDPEISQIAGPQLVVPVMNARYALNAANARWGSLYDSLYGTDVIPESDGAEIRKDYNPVRGAKVVAFAMDFLDETFPLNQGSHRDVAQYAIKDRALVVTFSDGQTTNLSDPSKFCGYTGKPDDPASILYVNHGLHVDVLIDRQHPVGQAHPAGIKDVVMEAAITTIQDCEDSVATVDADDKAIVYRNWLGLMKGDLSESFQKSGKTLTRRLNPDREYTAPDGSGFTLPGRSLLLVRDVGHLMYTDAVLDHQGNEIPEGILDGYMTSLIAMYDLQGTGPYRNSRTGSIYIVKPKMHGPEEVAFTDTMFGCIEDVLGLPRFTIKMGIMDEERRTSLNLKECIRAAKNRVVFINTGFLDRTGDEIHTSGA